MVSEDKTPKKKKLKELKIKKQKVHEDELMRLL